MSRLQPRQREGFARATARPPAQRRRRGRSLFNWVSLLASGFLTAAAVALAGCLVFIVEVSRPGPAETDKSVVVARGASVTAIARMLHAESEIRSPLEFRLATMVYGAGAPLKAGEYALPAGASLRTIVQMMASGAVVQHPITAAEGLTSAMIADIVNNADVLTGDPVAAPPEGTLLPETYNVQRGADRAAVIRQMQEAQSALLEELWPRRARDLPFSTPEEALILASIVEKETAVPAERGHIASVFVNRLRRGMRLESDPTIIYGLTRGRPLGRGIRASELAQRTAYNTYQIDGLPPTPIGNPGRASIEAVLNPASTNDLFFVADGTGGHIFSATMAEHQRNVARWRQIERQRAAASPPPADRRG